MAFSGKVVLITAANSGIGAGTAIHFSRLSASLAITARDAESLQKVADICTQPIFVVVGDLEKENDTKNIIESTIKHYGRLDVLVNNPVNSASGTIETTTMAEFDRCFNRNVRSVYHLTMLAVPHLIKTRGNIVNVSCLGGLRSFPLALAYCMSKSAVDHFTRCVALELAEKRVRVNCVNPGVVETDFHERMGYTAEKAKAHYERSKEMYAHEKIGNVEDVVLAIAFLASDSASFMTGVTLPVDGGRHSMCPQ